MSVRKEASCIHCAQDSGSVLISYRHKSTLILPCFFLRMASVLVGAFKVRTTEQVSRKTIGGFLRAHFSGVQVKTLQKLSRNIRAVDSGFSLYVETADNLDEAGRNELATLLTVVGEVTPVRDEDAVRSRELSTQFRIAREREAAGIVLGHEALNIAERLLQFRGEGGPQKKKRKFAEALGSIIEQGQKIAYVAHHRRIARTESEDNDGADSE